MQCLSLMHQIIHKPFDVVDALFDFLVRDLIRVVVVLTQTWQPSFPAASAFGLSGQKLASPLALFAFSTAERSFSQLPPL
jgi:hypothetical protein